MQQHALREWERNDLSAAEATWTDGTDVLASQGREAATNRIGIHITCKIPRAVPRLREVTLPLAGANPKKA